MTIIPPGFQHLSQIQENTCGNCVNYSHAYDGYCIKYDYKITSENTICEDFFPKRKISCQYCFKMINEDATICPFCDIEITVDLDSTISNEEQSKPESIAPEINYTEGFLNKFNIWKQYLLNLSKRNLQLHFPVKSKRIVEILHPSIENLVNQILIQEKRVKFLPIFNPEIVSIKLSDNPDEKKKRLNMIRDLYDEALRDALHNPKPNSIISNLDDLALEKQLNSFLIKSEHALEEKGVNILFLTLGLLKWNEKDSNDFIHSPILLIPIKVSRVNVNTAFSFEIFNNEVLLNPSLKQKIKIDHNLEVPKIPNIDNASDIVKYFEEFKVFISNMVKWKLIERIFLSTFSFSKISLFEDLNIYQSYFFSHPFIRALAENTKYADSIDIEELPPEIKQNQFAINTFSVLDIDHSQMQAVDYIEKGYSCVIRGPPGTGKSQCIANVISECLSDKKKVLFVAQKSAALEVVKERLDATGVGEFCLELHSNKANKRYVLDQIAHTYNTDLKPYTVPNEKYNTLNRLSDQLNSYVEEINSNYGPSQILLEQKIAELDKLRDIKSFKSLLPNVETLSEDNLYQIEELLTNIEDFEYIRVNYLKYPWRLSNLDQPPQISVIDLQNILFKFQIALEKMLDSFAIFQDRFKLLDCQTPDDLHNIKNFFDKYNVKSLSFDIDSYKTRYKEQFDTAKKFFQLDYYKFLSELKPFIKKPYKNSVKNHINNIYLFQHRFLHKEHGEAHVKLLVNNVSIFQNNLIELIELDKEIQRLQLDPILVKLPLIFSKTDDASKYWSHLLNHCTFWQKQLESFNLWCNFTTYIQKLQLFGLDFLLKEITSENGKEKNLAQKFKKSYLKQYISNFIKSNTILNSFHEDRYKKKIEDFNDLDRNTILINRYRLAKRLFETRSIAPWLYLDDLANEIGYLNRELIKRSRNKPLRDIFIQSKNYLLSLKPCLLMSPLSIATYLPLEDYYRYFDLVIFDEASQVCTEDAIGAIIRGKQVVIVGDEKQLPPTRFFATKIEKDFDGEDDTEVELYESVLEEAICLNIPVFTLRNHYRSKREDLIVFSNYNYYDSSLITFPDIYVNNESNIDEKNLAIEFNYVKKGIYDRGKSRTNKVEAQAVVDAIIDHYKQNYQIKDKNKRKSLGVIAFNSTQMDAIQNLLEKQLKNIVDIEKKIDFSSTEKLFIKNIENVQGNERDVIIFSIGYGFDDKNQFRLNFGALNQQGGERRLNVAITRSRYNVKIFCSFNPFEINYQKSQSKGLRNLFEYLQFAYSQKLNVNETGSLIQASINLQGDLQKSIGKKLNERGYEVELCVGKSKNQIDIGIIHPNDSSKYILGIILDHGAYAFSPNTTERERIRPSIFQSLGWNLFHIYSISWFTQYDKILNEIEQKIKNILNNSISKKENKISDTIKKSFFTESEFYNNNKKKSKQKKIYKKKLHLLPENRRKLLKIPGLTEYKPYVSEYLFNEEDIALINENNVLISEIVKIILFEQPIHYDILMDRISALFAYDKLPSKPMRVIKNTLTSKILPKFLKDGDFIEKPGQLPYKVRITVDPEKETRNFYQISNFEIINTIKIILTNGGQTSISGLKISVFKFFGIESKSKKNDVRWNEIMEILNVIKDILIYGEKITLKSNK